MQKDIKFYLVNIGHAVHNADWNYQKVVSPFTRIYMVESGRARVYLPDASVDLEPGYLYIVPAYYMHNYECTGHFSLYYLHLFENEKGAPDIGENYNFQYKVPLQEIDGQLIRHLLQNNSNKGLLSYDPDTYNNQMTFMDSMKSSASEALYLQMENDGALQVLMSHLLKYAKPKNQNLDDRISSTLLYIRTNLSKPLRITDLAQRVCISEEYFTRLFSRQIGEPPVKYIQKKKIQRAQLLLLTENMPIKELAYAVGFDDVPYFNRFFKKMTGYTPKEYKIRNV